MIRIVAVLRLLGIVFGIEVLILLLLATGPGLLAEGAINDPGAGSAAWLPLVHDDPTTSPLPTPALSSSPYEVQFLIIPSGSIKASTGDRDSFILRNLATNGQAVSSVRIDLSTAVYSDMVFDPFGQGGDTLAEDLQVDFEGGAGFTGHHYKAEHEGRFTSLELEFNSFDPGEEFRFSVDTEHSGSRGVAAPGFSKSDSASDLELLGSTVTVRFADGKELVNQTFRIP